MKNHMVLHKHKLFGKLVILSILVFAIVLSGVITVAAQDEFPEQVQVINGTVFNADDLKIYTVLEI